MWDRLWGQMNDETGVPVMLGEWGGVGEATSAWQQKMTTYLEERGISYFYWALNDNW